MRNEENGLMAIVDECLEKGLRLSGFAADNMKRGRPVMVVRMFVDDVGMNSRAGSARLMRERSTCRTKSGTSGLFSWGCAVTLLEAVCARSDDVDLASRFRVLRATEGAARKGSASVFAIDGQRSVVTAEMLCGEYGIRPGTWRQERVVMIVDSPAAQKHGRP
jgi:hypothetical protein